MDKGRIENAPLISWRNGDLGFLIIVFGFIVIPKVNP